MKKILIEFIVFIVLFSGLVTFYKKWLNTQEQYLTAILNNKAFVAQNDSLKEKTRVFEFTIDLMHLFNDSINEKMLAVAKEIGVKEKYIESTQYIKTEVTKTDTVVIKDTIFKEPSFKLDTIIGDLWYTSKIGLLYPNIITVSPKFTNELFIIVNSKKEYVNKPSKIFFIRWFLKKQTILEVNVKNTNPYMDIQENRFIKILK